MAKNNKQDKLAQESAMALAAGMSYGKWKAMQSCKEIKRTDQSSNWRICEWCGKPFMLKTNRNHVKCIECRRMEYDTAHKKRKAKPKTV